MQPSFYIKLYIPRHLSKKNNRNIRNNRPYKSAELKKAEEYLTLAFKNEWRSNPAMKGDLWCKIIFHCSNYYTKQGLRNRKLPDLSNLFHLPTDCLQKAGVIIDDTDICSFDGSRRIASEVNYVEIYLTVLA